MIKLDSLRRSGDWLIEELDVELDEAQLLPTMPAFLAHTTSEVNDDDAKD